MTALCCHIPYEAGVIVQTPARRFHTAQQQVHCPCCGLGQWREADDDLAGDDCTFCWVQLVPSPGPETAA